MARPRRGAVGVGCHVTDPRQEPGDGLALRRSPGRDGAGRVVGGLDADDGGVAVQVGVGLVHEVLPLPDRAVKPGPTPKWDSVPMYPAPFAAGKYRSVEDR
ncbi:MAG: hypothetical protein IPN98_16550 [Propionivibrio sp.]|nr:hypothetical protein [Propionivibrio sp.]